MPTHIVDSHASKSVVLFLPGARVSSPGSRFAWLVPLGMLGWFFDIAENGTHYTMARNYPDLSSFALKFGPLFNYGKWVLAIVTPIVGIAGFLARRV